MILIGYLKSMLLVKTLLPIIFRVSSGPSLTQRKCGKMGGYAIQVERKGACLWWCSDLEKYL